MKVYDLRADSHFQTIVPTPGTLPKSFAEGFRADPMASIWTIPNMKFAGETEGWIKGDFAEHPRAPFFSERAVEVLRDILEPAGELLPVHCGDEQMYAFNVLNVVDAVDEDASKAVRFSDGSIMRFEVYAFRESALRDQYIYKIPMWRHTSQIFVTDSFVQRVVAAGLTGFQFDLLWRNTQYD